MFWALSLKTDTPPFPVSFKKKISWPVSHVTGLVNMTGLATGKVSVVCPLSFITAATAQPTPVPFPLGKSVIASTKTFGVVWVLCL
jgi:hypothetical protein